MLFIKNNKLPTTNTYLIFLLFKAMNDIMNDNRPC